MFCLVETPVKLVDMDTVQGVVAQKNEDITNRKAVFFERKPNEEMCHICQFCRGLLSGKTNPNAYALGNIFVSDQSLTNIVVLDKASILFSGCLKN